MRAHVTCGPTSCARPCPPAGVCAHANVPRAGEDGCAAACGAIVVLVPLVGEGHTTPRVGDSQHVGAEADSEAFTAFVREHERRIWQAVAPVAGPDATPDAVPAPGVIA